MGWGADTWKNLLSINYWGGSCEFLIRPVNLNTSQMKGPCRQKAWQRVQGRGRTGERFSWRFRECSSTGYRKGQQCLRRGKTGQVLTALHYSHTRTCALWVMVFKAMRSVHMHHSLPTLVSEHTGFGAVFPGGVWSAQGFLEGAEAIWFVRLRVEGRKPGALSSSAMAADTRSPPHPALTFSTCLRSGFPCYMLGSGSVDQNSKLLVTRKMWSMK